MEEAASSEASIAQASLQVPNLVAWSAHRSDRRRSEERTHLPLLEGGVHLQLLLAAQFTNARSTQLSKSSTNIVLLLQRTQETPADSITRWPAHTTANRAKSRTIPLLLAAADCDQASASKEQSLGTPALPSRQLSITQHPPTQTPQAVVLRIGLSH